MLMGGTAMADEKCKGDKPGEKPTPAQVVQAKTADFMKKRWGKVDSNRDGVISKEEYLKEATDRFNATDINRDGKITPEEVKQFFEKSQAQRPPQPTDPKPDAQPKQP